MMKLDLKAAQRKWIEEAETDERVERENSDFLAYCDDSGRFADFHSNRHTFITSLERVRISPRTAQSLARHSDIRLTMGIYTHIELHDQRDGKANEKNPWRLFDNYLQTAGQFANPGTVPSKPPAKITIDPTEWQNEVAAIEQRWHAVVQPTYAVQAIKASAIKGGPKPHGAEKGGAEWG